MKWAGIIGGLFILGLVAGAWYLHTQLAVVMSLPPVRLVATAYTSAPTTGPLRQVDLGYAQFSLPADIPGNVVRFDEGGWAGISADGELAAISFGLPMSSSDPEVRSMLVSLEPLAGHPVASLHEMRVAAMAARPITIWDVPRLGYERTVSAMGLALTKTMLFSGAESVRLFESTDLAVWIEQRDRAVFAVFCDRRMDSSQLFIIDPQKMDLDRILGAVISTYRFVSQESTDSGFIGELEATGLPLQTIKVEPVSSEELIDEIRQRRRVRASRTKSGGG